MKDTIVFPREITDDIAEAICKEARCCGGIANDIWEAIVAAAPVDDGWIKCSDRLPEDGDTVIIWDGDDSTHAIYKNRKFHQDISWCSAEYSVIDNEIGDDWVTHWRQLPAPPSAPLDH